MDPIIDQVIKLDPRTVRVQLKRPDAVFPEDIGLFYNPIYTVDYDPRKPIGTGPFMFESFTPGVQSVFARFPNYWQTGKPYVDELIMIDFSDPTSLLNALLSGEVDAIDSVPVASLSTLKSNSGIRIFDAPGGLTTPIYVRVDLEPFRDVRVRLALKLAVNRPEIVSLALGGQGTVANDIYSPFDPDYDRSIPQHSQDYAQAKSLLQAAGHSDLSFTLVVANVAPGAIEAAQLFAQQASGPGIKVNVQLVDVTDIYGPNYLKWPAMIDYWSAYNYLQQASAKYIPSKFASNEDHWAPAEFISLLSEARATFDAAKRRDILHQAMRLQWADSGTIISGFANLVSAASTKVTGFVPSNYRPLGNYGCDEVQFVA